MHQNVGQKIIRGYYLFSLREGESRNACVTSKSQEDICFNPKAWRRCINVSFPGGLESGCRSVEEGFLPLDHPSKDILLESARPWPISTWTSVTADSSVDSLRGKGLFIAAPCCSSGLPEAECSWSTFSIRFLRGKKLDTFIALIDVKTDEPVRALDFFCSGEPRLDTKLAVLVFLIDLKKFILVEIFRASFDRKTGVARPSIWRPRSLRCKYKSSAAAVSPYIPLRLANSLLTQGWIKIDRIETRCPDLLITHKVLCCYETFMILMNRRCLSKLPPCKINENVRYNML